MFESLKYQNSNDDEMHPNWRGISDFIVMHPPIPITLTVISIPFELPLTIEGQILGGLLLRVKPI